ncbi:MAG: arylesterase [Pyrinomonadaceae bacterium]|nr:arylesterase [Pyrinomonadaceae bacterium]
MRKNIALVIVLLGLSLLSSCTLSGAAEAPEHTKLPTEIKRPDKGAETPKIIAFGDSLTAGFGLSEKESYPYLLQQMLEKDGFRYEVVNAGVSGDTTLAGLERVDWVLGQDNVKVMILELGANDLMRGVPVETIRENLDKIITKAKAKNVEVLFCGMLAPQNVSPKYQKAFVYMFPALATKHDVRFLPFLLEGVALEKELNQADGIHPNAKGAKIMTDNVYKELKPMLEARRDSAKKKESL